jgi:hypothetical protein
VNADAGRVDAVQRAEQGEAAAGGAPGEVEPILSDVLVPELGQVIIVSGTTGREAGDQGGIAP